MLLQREPQCFEQFIVFCIDWIFFQGIPFKVISFECFKRVVLQDFYISFSCCIVGKPIVLPAFSSHPVNGSVGLNGSTSFQHWCEVDAVDLVFNTCSCNVGQGWKKVHQQCQLIGTASHLDLVFPNNNSGNWSVSNKHHTTWRWWSWWKQEGACWNCSQKFKSISFRCCRY